MKNNTVATSLLFLVYLMLSINPVSGLAQSIENGVEKPFDFELRKTEMVELKYAPTGELSSSIAKVSFEVYNNGSEVAEISIIDRIESINASTLKTLYGTPFPDRIDVFGNFTKLIWEDVVVNNGSSIEYQYVAETSRALPIDVNTTLLVNSQPANIRRLNDLYVVDVNVSDVITFEIGVKNTAQALYTGEETVTPPLECIISTYFPTDYLSIVKTIPASNSTSVTAGISSNIWLVLLDDSARTFSVSARITKTSPWGEAIVEPISIQVSCGSTLLNAGFKSLDTSIEMVEDVKQVYHELGDATSQMYEMVKDISSSISEVSEESRKRVLDALTVISYSLAACTNIIEEAEASVIIAIGSFEAFLADERTVQFLFDNPDLAFLAELTRTYMDSVYASMEELRVGNPDSGIPGLNALHYMASQISIGVNSLIEGIEGIVESLEELANGIESVSDTAYQAEEDANNSLEEIMDEKRKFEVMDLVLRRKQTPPYDVEIRYNQQQNGYVVVASIQPAGENVWVITNVTITNVDDYPKIVYGLALQLLNYQQSTQPPAIEIFINGTWQPFDRDMTQLGIAYNPKESTLYLWPRSKVDPKSKSNILLDWTGHPMHVKLMGATQPEIECKADLAVVQSTVHLKTTKGQIIYTITQPHFIEENVTWTDHPSPLPPPLPPQRSWMQVILDYLQNPSLQLWIVVPLVLVLVGVLGGSLYKRRSQLSRYDEEGNIETGVKAVDLLDEVESLINKLEEPNNRINTEGMLNEKREKDE